MNDVDPLRHIPLHSERRETAASNERNIKGKSAIYSWVREMCLGSGVRLRLTPQTFTVQYRWCSPVIHS